MQSFRSKDLAEAFYNQCDYSPGEYATLRKNFVLGIMPSLSGKFNNNYYIEGMGCLIRSEIWACMAPGDAKFAAELAALDGCIDHYGESIIAKQYLAALESLAFTDKWDIKTLVVRVLDYIDEKSRVYELVSKVVNWCDQYNDWRMVFGRILRDYGHADCTNMYQNIGITLMALLLGEGNFIDSTMLALNCGFDTDCTCATVGAVIGIVKGGKKLMKEHNLPEQRYKLGVRAERRSDLVYDLAEDTAYAALLFMEKNKKVNIKGAPEDKMPVITGRTSFPVDFKVVYNDGIPAIAPGESKNVTVYFESNIRIKASGVIRFTAPEGFTVKPAEKRFKIGMFSSGIDVTVSVAKDNPVLMNKNIITATITLDNNDAFRESFGFAGTQLWKIYGPFWENTTYVAPPGPNESYYSGLGGSTSRDEEATKIRQFHINMKADWHKEYLEDQLLGNRPLPFDPVNDPAYLGFPVPCMRINLTSAIYSGLRDHV